TGPGSRGRGTPTGRTRRPGTVPTTPCASRPWCRPPRRPRRASPRSTGARSGARSPADASGVTRGGAPAPGHPAPFHRSMRADRGGEEVEGEGVLGVVPHRSEVEAAQGVDAEGEGDLAAVVDVVLGDVPHDPLPRPPGPLSGRVVDGS